MKFRAAALIFLSLLFLFQPVVFQQHAAFADGDSKSGDDLDSLLDNLFNENEDEQKKEEKTNDDSEQQRKKEKQPFEKKVIEDEYTDVLNQWKSQGIAEVSDFQTIVHPKNFISSNLSNHLVSAEDSKGYDETAFLWDETVDHIQLKITVPESGLYNIEADYRPLPGKIKPVLRGVQINGKYPFYEARRIVFERRWKNAVEEFQTDELGNQIFPAQKEIRGWFHMKFMDSLYLHDRPLKFYLKKGVNTLTLINLEENMLLGRITIRSPEPLPTYEDYKKQNDSKRISGEQLYEIEAEHPAIKSVSSVRAVASGDPGVTPNRGTKISLNTLGGDTWKSGGESVTWTFDVEEPGYYHIALKNTQYFKVNMPVFRTVKIDGRIPFKDMLSYPFDYASGWENDILTNEKGKPYDFYLQKGKHRITLIADPAPYQPVVNTIKDVMDDINDLALEIKMATGNTKDLYRDWHITERIPDIVPRLKELSKVLREQYRYLQTLSETNPDQARNLVISADQLDRLASEPEKIPVRFEQLSKGTDSITKKLGNLLLTLADQPLQLDKIYVFANTKLPDPEASVWLRMKSAVVSFFSSFTRDYTTISHADDREALKIWVNRPRQYVMLMQQLADQYFTKKTGTEVAFSLMPAEEKLILANASGESPDIAMGVQENLPYKLALRGALVDLSQFGDYKNTAARFSEGALLPFYFDGGRYALPSTQDFWVLFYRKDILQALNIAVPSTWEDVKETLPKLQRYGMNFYVPLSGVSAYKEFKVTAPFIYQQGGRLFSKDGMSAAIDSEEALKGFKLMTNLFTIYSSPLQVPNFYSHFRNGTLPMGIADFNQYIHITAAAPELNGQWGIAPYPGIKAENGKTVRWAPGTGKAVIMFRDSHKQKEAWAFMKWWTSAKVQAKFGNMIETIYGTEYRWNTANIKAFSQLPWPEKDINVIKEQWKWLRDIPHIPGDYMVERALSNAWNKVVFDGKNPRRAIEDAVVTANREIRKKLNEFGYVNKSGTVLKPLQMPAILREYGGVPDESGD